MNREQQCSGDRSRVGSTAVFVGGAMIASERLCQRVNEQDVDDVKDQIRQVKSERVGAAPQRIIERVREVDERPRQVVDRNGAPVVQIPEGEVVDDQTMIVV